MKLEQIIEAQKAWSENTVGPGPRTESLLAHLRKEIVEIEADPADLAEWVDVMIIAMDGAWRAGHTSAAIVDAVLRKQHINRERKWPDWRTHPEGAPFEHIRTEEEVAMKQHVAGRGRERA